MGKKSTKKSASDSNSTSNDDNLLPFVSICTPTYNRRPFWPMAIQCFNDYDYPKDRMEWIIVDDGTDCIEDVVKDIPQVRYFREEQQMVLGRKRNYTHEKAKGDIIVYQDDDDYYPPERVSNEVNTLNENPNIYCVGVSKTFMYFRNYNIMGALGPWSNNHCCTGSLAFRKELLNITSYGNFGQTNPHTQLYNYFRKLKLNVDEGELVKKICRNLIRPTINGELLKKYFDINDNDKCIEIIKNTYLSYT